MCQLVSFNHASWRTYGECQASCFPLTQSLSCAQLIVFFSPQNIFQTKLLYSTEAEVKSQIYSVSY